METYDLFFPSTDPNTRMVSVFGENADLLQLRGWSNADFNSTATLVAIHQSPYGADGPHDRPQAKAGSRPHRSRAMHASRPTWPVW